jgi:hypothetical protein
MIMIPWRGSCNDDVSSFGGFIDKTPKPVASSL